MSSDARKLAEAKLASSGLTLDDASDLGIRIVGSAAQINVAWPDVPALDLVYYDMGGEPVEAMRRVRLLEQPRGAFGQVSEQRYLQPGNTTPAAYFPRIIDWPAVAKNNDTPILITEGELKASCAAVNGYACIGLGGVWSWRSKKLGWDLLPSLKSIAWPRRDVVVVFDSDAKSNPQVAQAITSLMTQLSALGAVPRVAELPDIPGLGKVGLDDFIVARGANEFADVLRRAEGDELTRRLWEYNARFCFVLSPGIIYDRQRGIMYDPGKFRSTIYANEFATIRSVNAKGDEKIKRESLPDAWIKWPARYQLERITYAPGQPENYNGVLNVWRGWAVEPEPGDITPWTELLDHLIPEPELRRWFEAWCLYPLAHPGTKMQCGIGIWSTATGVGKTLIGSTLGRIYGGHDTTNNYTAINQDELESSFNEWMPRRNFVLVDDISPWNTRSKADVLKSRISEESISINEKHVARYVLPAVINFYCTSNHANAFYLEPDDRRWFIYEVKSEKLPREFWDRYYAWRDSIGPSALFAHAQSYDFSGFDPFDVPPMTEDKRRMIASGRNELEEFIARLVVDPDSILQAGGQTSKLDVWSAYELSEIYNLDRRGRPVTMSLLAARIGQYVKRVEIGGLDYFLIRNAEKYLRSHDEIKKHRASFSRGTGSDMC